MSARGRDAAALAVLAAWGFALSLVHGCDGFLPLDQSIVFDGGWRVLGGQVPYRDFTLPCGVVPIVMQAALFRLCGVSWRVYAAHAALLDGLFAAASYVLVRLCGGGRVVAFLAGALGAIVLYPPFGAPFPDQHAFFFAFLAIVAAVGASRRAAWALAVPPLLAFAYLSKQVPTVFVVPLAVLLVARPRLLLVRFVASATLTTVVLLLAALVLGVDAALVRDYAFTLPGGEGRARLLEIWTGEGPLTAVLRVLQGWILWSPALVAALAIGQLVRDTGRRRAGIALGLLGTCLAFSALTQNEEANGIPWIFAAAALVAVTLLEDAGRPARLALAMLAACTLRDAFVFERTVNVPRLVHGLQEMPADPAAVLPAPLRGLRWRLSPLSHWEARDLVAVTAYLRSRPGAFLLVGDTSLLYALAGKPSVLPALWYHRHLTIPGRRSPLFPAFDARLAASLRAHDVRTLVLEGEQTFDGTRARDFPAVAALLAREERRVAFGGFTAIEVAQP